MTVPASGELTFRGLSRECIYGDYNSASTPAGCVELGDMLTGGQPCSPSPTYPAVNTACSPNPGTTTGNNLISEWRGYDEGCVPLVGLAVYTTAVPKPVFACSQTTNGTWYFPDTTPAVNDQVYTDSGGTTTPSAGNYGIYQGVGSGSTNYRFTVNGSGVITTYASCSPSDRRLKKNIRLIGYSPAGLKIYAFEYLDKLFGEGVFQGVMSDEIPNYAVIKNGVGEYDAVDYSQIDVDFKRLYFS